MLQDGKSFVRSEPHSDTYMVGWLILLMHKSRAFGFIPSSFGRTSQLSLVREDGSCLYVCVLHPIDSKVI